MSRDLYDIVIGCYNSNSYFDLKEYMNDDCVYRSQWVFDEMRGKDKIAEYLIQKSVAIAQSGKFPKAKKVRLTSYPYSLAIAITQGDDTVAVILMLNIESDKISSFDLCEPGLFCYEDVQNNS